MNLYKKKFVIIIAVIQMLSCFGCTNSSHTTKSDQVVVHEYLGRELTTEDLRADNKQNICISSNCIINQLHDVDSIREFSLSSPKEDENNEFIRQFIMTYEYLFGKRFEDSCFYVDSEHSHIQYNENGDKISDLKRVYEMEEEIKNNKEQILALIYNDVSSSQKERSFMYYQSPLYCGGMSSFNRGKFYELCTSTKQKESIELSYPQVVLKPAHSYQPDSSETVMIDNKLVPINKLVKTYENYLNSLPVFTTTNVTTQVVKASVYKLPNSNNYCIGFTTTANYKNIPFDSTENGKEVTKDYSFMLGIGSMVKPDEVDSAYSIYRSLNIQNEVEYTQMLPADKALEIVSNELTKEIVFELQQVSLVYSVTAPSVYEREKDIRQCVASWKFTLYNKNDNRMYYCYVNAKDGKGFHYYSTASTEVVE